MVVINCTKKLFRRLKVQESSKIYSSTNLLGAWCANVFNIGRYPFVIFTNEKTLLSILFPLKEFKRISDLFNSSLSRQLKELKIPENIILAETKQTSEIVLSTNTNRRTLGSMNDLVFRIKAILNDKQSFTVKELERELREIPFSPISFSNAGEAVKGLLKDASPA
jgi:hypothetical protein